MLLGEQAFGARKMYSFTWVGACYIDVLVMNVCDPGACLSKFEVVYCAKRMASTELIFLILTIFP